MSACTFHLIRLTASANVATFSDAIRSLVTPPISYNRAHRWISTPSSPSLLPDSSWDILLIHPSSELDPSLSIMIERSWSATVETPDELSSAFLSHETVAHVAPPLTSSWAELGQAAETGPSHEVEIPLTSDLLSWAKDLPHHGPVHMLNLHAYSPGGRKKYMQYIQAFMEELGPKSGGVARFLGPIEGKEWDDIALVEYPNLQYFMELLASEDYQKMDQKYKIGSLRDGGILCVTKIEL